MQHYGLIGKTLRHSFSQQYFETNHPEVQYNLYELEHLHDLRLWVQRKCLSGFNVTIPYKIAILPFLDELTTEAATIGAVNCVKVVNDTSNKSGIRLIGHNTDAQAFLETFESFVSEKTSSPQNNKPFAFILGNGGAAKAVSFALQKLKIQHTILSHSDIDKLNNDTSPQAIPSILVNATPVGMFPHANETPLPHLCDTQKYKTLPRWFCYDLIYNPQRTKLLLDASLLGASTQNGLAMLYRQAELSLEFWTKK